MCGIFHNHWWTYSIKPKLLFPHEGSWGLSRFLSRKFTAIKPHNSKTNYTATICSEERLWCIKLAFCVHLCLVHMPLSRSVGLFVTFNCTELFIYFPNRLFLYKNMKNIAFYNCTDEEKNKYAKLDICQNATHAPINKRWPQTWDST